MYNFLEISFEAIKEEAFHLMLSIWAVFLQSMYIVIVSFSIKVNIDNRMYLTMNSRPNH